MQHLEGVRNSGTRYGSPPLALLVEEGASGILEKQTAIAKVSLSYRGYALDTPTGVLGVSRTASEREAERLIKDTADLFKELEEKDRLDGP